MSPTFSRRWVLLTGLSALVATQAQASEKPVVLLLTSDESPRSVELAAAFKAQAAGVTRLSYVLGPEVDAAAFLADTLRDMKVSAVAAFGDRAVTAASREFAATPLVYGEVSTAPPAVPGRQQWGLSVRVAPDQAIDRLKVLFPRATRIGFIRSAKDTEDAWWSTLEEAAASRQVTTKVAVASSAADLQNASSALFSQTDLLWLLPDPSLWSPAQVSRLLHDALLAGKPVVGVDRAWLEAADPAPLCFEASASGIGAAAARQVMAAVGLDATGGSAYGAPFLVGSKKVFRQAGWLLKKDQAAAVDLWIDEVAAP